MKDAPLLLIGSAPYETADETFHTLGPVLGGHLASMPDGEVQDRLMWIQRLYFQVFNGHPDIEVLQRPLTEDGVETMRPRNRSEVFKFRVKPGVEKLRLGLPGWRLGYAKDAINAYLLFKALRQQGVVPHGLRFQVSIPSPNSACNPSVFEADGLQKARDGYQDAVIAEVANICDHIPHDELAIQWDSSWEITDIYGGTSLHPEGALERNLPQYAALAAAVPEGVNLGIHLCFGTFGGWPRFAPDDLGAAVNLTNGIIATSGRTMDWVHIPTLDTVDEAFYAPLAKLDAPNTRIYLGMIHSMPTFEERLRVSRKYLSDFGIAAYCGFGRLAREEMEGIVQDHLDALKMARFD